MSFVETGDSGWIHVELSDVEESESEQAEKEFREFDVPRNSDRTAQEGLDMHLASQRDCPCHPDRTEVGQNKTISRCIEMQSDRVV